LREINVKNILKLFFSQFVESLCLSLHDSQPERYRFFSALVLKRQTALAIDSGQGGRDRVLRP
jgi:hypothetical protein